MHARLVDFHFIAAVKPTGVLEALDLADILTLVSSFSLYFSPYSNTNTTKSATAKPGQVRAALLLVMVPCNPVQPVTWSGSRQLNRLPYQFFLAGEEVDTSPRRMKSRPVKGRISSTWANGHRANLGEEFQPTKMHLSHGIANMASTLHA